MKQKIEKCKSIKCILTDVDGVLTDGGRYFSANGEKMKKFHVRDGMAINILLRNNINTIIVTKEESSIVKNWSQEMNVKVNWIPRSIGRVSERVFFIHD